MSFLDSRLRAAVFRVWGVYRDLRHRRNSGINPQKPHHCHNRSTTTKVCHPERPEKRSFSRESKDLRTDRLHSKTKVRRSFDSLRSLRMTKGGLRCVFRSSWWAQRMSIVKISALLRGNPIDGSGSPKIRGIATPVCGLVRDDVVIYTWFLYLALGSHPPYIRKNNFSKNISIRCYILTFCIVIV